MEKEFFAERYRTLGWEFFEPEIKKSIRVNTSKIDKKHLVKKLAAIGVKTSDISFARDGLFVEKSKFTLGSTVEHLLGYYFVQEAASQIPALLLNPSENDVVLDCCAAPGAKTTQISQLMKNKGVVVAIDKKSQRLIALKNNIERLGCKNIIVYNMDALNVSSLGRDFDKILHRSDCQ